MGYIAPLLDVVMLLLIFFLLSSQFIQRSGFAVDLPFSRSTLESLGDADVITIPTGREQRILLNDSRFALEELGERLKERAKTARQIVIRADQQASLSSLTNIINLARDAGFKDIAILTSPEAE